MFLSIYSRQTSTVKGTKKTQTLFHFLYLAGKLKSISIDTSHELPLYRVLHFYLSLTVSLVACTECVVNSNLQAMSVFLFSKSF